VIVTENERSDGGTEDDMRDEVAEENIEMGTKPTCIHCAVTYDVLQIQVCFCVRIESGSGHQTLTQTSQLLKQTVSQSALSSLGFRIKATGVTITSVR
jgi:hypothetical protein